MNNHNTPCCASVPRNNGCNNSCRTETTPNHSHHHSDTSCACRKAPFPVNTAYAMAYVPFQQSDEVYTAERALARGTIFPCLDKPFLMGCCK